MADMEKSNYLFWQFSHRTRNKDFENYVVNAIWNRVGDLEVLPVTQQFVRTKTGPRFIDLYFPQVGVAIECDELHHESDDQASRDAIREASVFDALTSVDEVALEGGIHRVKQAHFRDSGELESELDELADVVRKRVERQREAGTFKPWVQAYPDPVEYLRDREWLDLHDCARDRVGFRCVVDIPNSLFGTTLNNAQGQGWGSYRRLAEYDAAYGELHLSLAKLRVGADVGGTNWDNTLSSDGLTLRETHLQRNQNEGQAWEKELRVWFVKDPRRGKDQFWRFAGIYELQDISGGTRVWNRVATRLRLPKPGAPLDPHMPLFD